MGRDMTTYKLDYYHTTKEEKDSTSHNLNIQLGNNIKALLCMQINYMINAFRYPFSKSCNTIFMQYDYKYTA